MKKSDLRSGMRVKTREGGLYLVILDVWVGGEKDILFTHPDGGWMPGKEYYDDLTSIGNDSIDRDFDIMEVFTTSSREDDFAYKFMDLDYKKSIWKREDYTEEQKEMFKALKLLGFNWIAKDGKHFYELYAYINEPWKSTVSDSCWTADNACINLTSFKIFDFIKETDDKPFEIPTL